VRWRSQCWVASSWRQIRGDNAIDPENPAAPPETAIDPAQRAREFAVLDALPTATGFIGTHIMQHAQAHPDDPDLPWLLYVVVQSTSGGCLDPASHALSKQAFALLHKRFPDNQWARKSNRFPSGVVSCGLSKGHNPIGVQQHGGRHGHVGIAHVEGSGLA
jgi:hypothetical protein